MNKFLAELLTLAKELGVTPSKTASNVMQIKKPSLTRIKVDTSKLKDLVDQGTISTDEIKNELQKVVDLAATGKLNDVEMNRAINNIRSGRDIINPPAAEIVDLSSKQRVAGEGLETLKEKAGLSAAPGTPLGDLELRSKQLVEKAGGIEQALKEKPADIKSILDDFMKAQKTSLDLENEGLVRATVRNIMENDIKAGRLKSIKIGDLYNKDPIEYFRTNYGEGALEQVDEFVPQFKELYSADEAEKLVRSKYKLEPKEVPSDELNPFEKKAKGGIIGYKRGGQIEKIDINSVDPSTLDVMLSSLQVNDLGKNSLYHNLRRRFSKGGSKGLDYLLGF